MLKKIVEKILSDSDGVFLMPYQMELMEFYYEEKTLNMSFHPDFYNYFPNELKNLFSKYRTEKLNHMDWEIFSIPHIERDSFRKKIDNQWGKLRTEARTKWLEKNGSHTKKQIIELSKYQNYCCAYCGVRYSEETGVHKDHVVPVVHGGINDICNMVLACPSCNLSKYDNDPYTFMKQLEKKSKIDSYKSAKSRFDSIRKYAAQLKK